MTRTDVKLTAITRELNPAIGNCELTYLPRVGIDPALAQRRHEHYQAALASLGCESIVVPTEQGLADSVFIEDTALVLDEIAVLLRPGPQSRRPEVDGVERVLKGFRSLRSIKSPGTLDGGDLLRVGKVIFAGLSSRSNKEGIEQLSRIVADYGYSVSAVATTKCLHLKSAVSAIDPGTLLINPDWVSRSVFDAYELVEIDSQEPHAANALSIGRSIVYPSSFPRTAEKLVDSGIDVVSVDLSELQKAEGAVTCCSLLVSNSENRPTSRTHSK